MAAVKIPERSRRSSASWGLSVKRRFDRARKRSADIRAGLPRGPFRSPCQFFRLRNANANPPMASRDHDAGSGVPEISVEEVAIKLRSTVRLD